MCVQNGDGVGCWAVMRCPQSFLGLLCYCYYGGRTGPENTKEELASERHPFYADAVFLELDVTRNQTFLIEQEELHNFWGPVQNKNEKKCH